MSLLAAYFCEYATLAAWAVASIYTVMATFSKTDKEVVMVIDRSGLHRAHKLDVTLDHYHGKFRLHFLPAHCGHHLNPIEGFWRVMKNAIGAGRCFQDLV
jgi:transposase